MTPSRKLWAKSSKDGPGHSLLAHLLDVGIVAQQLVREVRLQTALEFFAEDLGLETQEAMRLVVVLAALHDVGKASPAFQSKWPPGAPPEALTRRFDDIPHGTISAAVLKRWLRDKGMHYREAETLAHAVGVHHGVMLPPGFDHNLDEDTPSIGSAPWSTWRTELIADVVRAFGPIPEFERNKGYRRALTWAYPAGLTSMADWIGSGLPHTGPVDDVGEYVTWRQVVVKQRLEQLNWPPGTTWWTPPTDPDRFSSWFQGTAAGEKPRALQLAVEKVLADLGAEPGLLVIEAPMGEGKTEAAFFASVRSLTTGGTYFGMPTQATSDAMYGRLAEFIARHANRKVSVALAHGAARLLARFSSEPDVTVTPILPPEIDQQLEPVDQEGIEASAVQVQWFSMGRKELLSEVGVGTADQALQAVIPTKHFYVKLMALAGKVVVLDEVHAYDEYTRGLIEELVRWLARLGSTVIVMSATLPESTRHALVSAYLDGIGAEAVLPEPATYPRLTLATPTIVRTRSFEAGRTPTYRVEPAPFDVEQLAELLSQLRAGGGAVGVVVNTVDRAQRLYRLCQVKGLEPSLLHARMPLTERKAREAELLRLYGPESRGRRDGLVIATQVVEQSLDVDFDVLVTDLAPIDLVLQRSGREHRHTGRSDRGAHDTPVLYVAGLGSGETGPEEEATKSVYDAYILWRSWAVLVGVDELKLPLDIDTFVQAVYDVDQPLTRLMPYADRMAGLIHVFHTETMVKRGAANAWLIGHPDEPATKSWGLTATDDDERARGRVRAPTRLGDSGVAVVPLFRTQEGWRLHGETRTSVSRSGRAGRYWVQAALMSQFNVRNKGLVAKVEGATRPDWWGKQKLLKHLHPLMLTEEGVALIDSNVRLDAELGLLISRGGP